MHSSATEMRSPARAISVKLPASNGRRRERRPAPPAAHNGQPDHAESRSSHPSTAFIAPPQPYTEQTPFGESLSDQAILPPPPPSGAILHQSDTHAQRLRIPHQLSAKSVLSIFSDMNHTASRNLFTEPGLDHLPTPGRSGPTSMPGCPLRSEAHQPTHRYVQAEGVIRNAPKLRPTDRATWPARSTTPSSRGRKVNSHGHAHPGEKLNVRSDKSLNRAGSTSFPRKPPNALPATPERKTYRTGPIRI